MRAHVDGPPLTRLEELIWIGSIPRAGAARYPERHALLFADRDVRVTYRELDRQSDACVALMQAHGIRCGDRIAYLGRNSDLFYPVLFGAIRAGVVLVPLNWRLAAPEIAYQLGDSQTRLLICDPDLVGTAAAAGRELDSPPALLLTESDGSTDNLRGLLARSAAPAALPQSPDQVILQLYTSGTTGRPKGVLVSHHALSIARHCELSAPEFSVLTAGSISLSAMPNFHVGGLSWVLMGLIRGATVVVTANPAPDNMLALVNEHAVNHSFIVPTVIRAIVEDIKRRRVTAPAIEGIFYGAMSMDGTLLRESMDLFGCSFGQFFGMTEITGAATFLSPADHDPARPHLLKSVGKPYPGMSIEIRGRDGGVLRPGEHGEIWIRSPTRMLGYWGLPDETAAALVDGWYASGDGGYLDDDGYLYLTDRIKDMIVSGGENVYPAEVEEVLRTHAAILDAACVGVSDAVWGESIAAVLELRPGQAATVQELRDFTRARIAGYKCPKQFHVVDALPRTASGKVKRAELRARLRASITHGKPPP